MIAYFAYGCRLRRISGRNRAEFFSRREFFGWNRVAEAEVGDRLVPCLRSPTVGLFGDFPVCVDVRDVVSVQELLQCDVDDLSDRVSVFAGEPVEAFGGVHQDPGIEWFLGRAALRFQACGGRRSLACGSRSGRLSGLLSDFPVRRLRKYPGCFFSALRAGWSGAG